MNHLRRGLLYILLFLSFGYNKTMANENQSATNEPTNNEDEEICDQELAQITIVNYGDKLYVLCLETDENNRIKGLRYNTHHEETLEFLESKIYHKDQLGLELHGCTPSYLAETSHETPLANQDLKAPLNSADQNELSRAVLGIEDNTNPKSCISSRRINIDRLKFLRLQTSHFNAYEGGDLSVGYRSHLVDFSYERLYLRLSKYNDEWILSDIDDHRVRALDVEINRPRLLFGAPFGIKSIQLIYEEDELERED